MAACAAAGVGSGSTEDDVSEDSCASRKRSAGSRVQSVSTSGRLSTYGIVVLVERRSERVVKGLSAPLAPPPPPPPPD